MHSSSQLAPQGSLQRAGLASAWAQEQIGCSWLIVFHSPPKWRQDCSPGSWGENIWQHNLIHQETSACFMETPG